jgi:hypothetical protein
MAAVPAPPASAQAPISPADLSLVDITTLVGPGSLFRLVMTAAPPQGGDLAVSIYPRVNSRSEFDLAANGTFTRAPLEVLSYDPAQIRRPDGALQIDRHVATLTETLPTDLRLRQEGVYPLTVSTRQPDGTDQKRVIAFFVYFPEPRLPPPFKVAIVTTLAAAPGTAPDGTLTSGFSTTIAASLRPAARLIAAATARRVPIDVAARGLTLDEWASIPGLEAEAAAAVPLGPEYLAETYAGLSSSVLAENRLGDEIDSQIRDGRAALHERGLTPTVSVAVLPPGPPGSRSLRRLQQAGATAVVVPELALDPLDLQFTLTKPFTLDLRGSQIQAAAPDPVLSDIVSRPTDQPRAIASRVFAELTVLYLDAPADPRAAVVSVNGPPDARLFDPLLSDLAAAGYLQPTTLLDLFASVPAARDGADAQKRLVRTLRSSEPALPASLAPSLLDARSRLAALRALTGDEAPVQLGDRLITVAEGAPNPRLYVDAVDRIVAGGLDTVSVLSSDSLTLAGSDGVIPMRLRNSAAIPLTVTVTATSDRLRFPGGRAVVRIIPPGDSPLDLRVEALSTGSFPLDVTIATPCPHGEATCSGQLPVGRPARVTVTSTKASAVAIAIAGGALLFLLLWWGREIVRPRRRRRLNPEAAPADQ